MLNPSPLWQGFENVNIILQYDGNGIYQPWLLVQIIAAKVLATSICRSTGLVGGLYAPSIFMGAVIGSAFCEIVQALPDPTGGSLHPFMPAPCLLHAAGSISGLNCMSLMEWQVLDPA